MAHVPRVALLIETARGYGRGLLNGIVRYARLHGPWSFYISPGDFDQAVPRMKSWGGTGIIARIETPKMARALCRTGLPTIALDLTAEQTARDSPLTQFSEIHPDPVASVNLAIDHLLERSFKRFAFVGAPGRFWSQQREEAFTRRVAKEGLEYHVYRNPRTKRDQEWGREQTTMAAWVEAIPKPIGLMTCNDDRGRQVLEACRAGGVEVPDEVAVVGMDNDELLCELSNPALSSVALNTERGGYEAAALLDRMMQRKVRSPRHIVVEPLWVVTRQSTDVLAIDDRKVARALRFIRANASEPIRVKDVLRAVPISRRALEMRFRHIVGRSINAEIQNAHFRRSQELLLETDYPIARVAEMAGFRSASYMGQIFRHRVGKTPARYRLELRSC